MSEGERIFESGGGGGGVGDGDGDGDGDVMVTGVAT